MPREICLYHGTPIDRDPGSPLRHDHSHVSYNRRGKNYTWPRYARYITAESHVFLVVGRSGSGKSRIGNTLLGRYAFGVGDGSYPVTRRSQIKSTIRGHIIATVLDTPDIFSLSYEPENQVKEVERWKTMTSHDQPIILLAVRLDMDFTVDDYAIYKEFKRLWADDPDIGRHLVVAFTFGDRIHRDLVRELKDLSQELKSVLKDACNRYVVFKVDEDERDIDEQFNHFSNVINEWQTQHRFVHIQRVMAYVMFIIALIAVGSFVMGLIYHGMEVTVGAGLLCLALAVLWYCMRSLKRLPLPKIIMSHL